VSQAISGSHAGNDSGNRGGTGTVWDRGVQREALEKTTVPMAQDRRPWYGHMPVSPVRMKVFSQYRERADVV